jgi:polysaccharide biosynthesis transport protein
VELKHFIILLKRWYWLIILGIVIGAAGGIVFSRIQTPIYESSAKILVMRAPDQSNAVLAYLSPTELAITFSQLITTQRVLDDLSNQMGIKLNKSMVQVQQVANSQIIQVSVQADDPNISAEIANGLVDTAARYYVDLQTNLYITSENNVQAQIAAVQTKVADLQNQISVGSEAILNGQIDEIQSQMIPLADEITQLQQDISVLSPVVLTTTADQKAQLGQKQARLAQIQPIYEAYQKAYSDLVVTKKPMQNGSVDLSNLALLQDELTQYQQKSADLTIQLNDLKQAHIQGLSNVVKMEEAYAPKTYIRPQPTMNLILGTAVGLILAVALVFLVENLNISIKMPEFLKRRPKKVKAEADDALITKRIAQG